MAAKVCEVAEVHPIPLIVTLRGQKVLLDAELARLYGVLTKRLNEQVRRNVDRFPADFVFQLTAQEVLNLKSQIATSSFQDGLKSQVANASEHGGRRKLPYAFTEHGAIMAATVLNSPQAIEMSVFVVRAFVKMREHLISTHELARRLSEIEKQLVVHDSALVELYQQIQPLLLPPDNPPQKPIGFGV